MIKQDELEKIQDKYKNLENELNQSVNDKDKYVSLSKEYADLNEILDAGKVRIAVPESFAPFGSLGADGEPEGFDVDVAKLIAEDLGVDLELVPVTSKQRIPYLETDKVDLVISSMGANPGRAKSIWFSSAYAPFFSGAFASADKSISGVSDLAGYKIGLTAGTLEDLELTDIAPDNVYVFIIPARVRLLRAV